MKDKVNCRKATKSRLMQVANSVNKVTGRPTTKVIRHETQGKVERQISLFSFLETFQKQKIAWIKHQTV